MTVVTVLMVLVVRTTSWNVFAQGGSTPARFVAPFEVVDLAGKPILRVIAAGEPVGAPVVVTGGATGGAGHGVYVNNQAGVRVAALGQARDGSGVFAVRNTAGQDMFHVTDREPRNAGVVVTGSGVDNLGSGHGLYVLNANGTRVAALAQGAAGHGVLALRDTQGSTRVRVDGDGSAKMTDAAGKGILRIGEKVTASDARVTIGSSGSPLYAVTVSNSSGAPVAVFGEAKAGGGVFAAHNASGTIRAILSGTGQIHVANDGGHTLATMVAEADMGAFSVRNLGGSTIVRISQAVGSGGFLQLADAGGTAVVEGGAFANGRGIVRTFPSGAPGGSLVGMPGTFILGWGRK